MLCSKNESSFISNLSDLTLQIIFDTWWAWMNAGSKLPIDWIKSRHGSSWRFLSHCRIEETGYRWTICIVCHQVLCHSSEPGTSVMGNHLLAKAHIAKLNKLTESEVTELTSSTVNEIAFAILNRDGSWRITIVYSQSEVILYIPHYPYWSKRQTKHSKQPTKDFETFESHQDMWNCYPCQDIFRHRFPGMLDLFLSNDGKI
jgi:hypothetical protein